MSIINDVFVDKLFKDPPKRTKEIPLLSEKTVSGDGMVVINDAYSDFPIKNLTLQGNTKQDSTTGKNLFSSNYDEYTLPLNYYIYPLILNKGETYTASIKSVSKIKNIVIYILRSGSAYPFENTEIVSILLNLEDTLGDKKATFTVDETFTAPVIAIYARSKESFNSLFEAKEIQLEKGSIATSYEPYTGGKPSPSPDYPQEIKNVGKWNEETQKYEVNIRITNAKESWDKEQTLTLTSDRPITKWDKLVEQDGVYGWLYKSNIIKNFNGIGYDIQPGKEPNENIAHFAINFPDSKKNGAQTSSDLFVDKFKAVPSSYIQNKTNICFNWNNCIKYFSSPKAGIVTVDAFSEWLKTNPLHITYETEIAEFIPLPQDEQDAIRALTTYYPTTVVTVDGGELPVGIEVTYMHPEYIPTKQSALRMWFKENPII